MSGCEEESEPPCQHGEKREFVCGNDMAGVQPQTCVDGAWYSTSFCAKRDGTRHPDDQWGTNDSCVAGATRAAVCGDANKGLEPQECRGGAWVATNACSYGGGVSNPGTNPPPTTPGEDPKPVDPSTCAPLTAELANGGKTLPEDTCYLLESDLTVNDGTLVIKPGVTIIASMKAALTIRDAGRLDVQGSAAKPVSFQGKNSERGFWGGILITGTGDGQHNVEHAWIRHAGSTEHQYSSQLRAGLSAATAVRLNVRNSRFEGNRGPALNIHTSDSRVDISNVRFHDNEYPLRIRATQLGSLGDDLVFKENKDQDGKPTNYVLIEHGSPVTADAHWHEYHYVSKVNVVLDAAVTVAPGARLHFESGTSLQMRGDNGSLTAIGTESKPIIFSSVLERRGTWNGLYFRGSTAPSNVLEHVRVEYGGGEYYDHNTSLQGGIVIGTGAAALSLENVVMFDNEHSALTVQGSEGKISVQDTTFEKNEVPLRLSARHIGGLKSGLDFIDNDDSTIIVARRGDESVRQNATWKRYDASYRFENRFGLYADIVAEAGTIFAFASATGIEVRTEGSLHAVGTSANRVVFQGVEPLAGTWDGLWFRSRKGANELTYADVKHGGGLSRGHSEAHRGNIVLQDNALLKVSHLNVTHSDGFGIATRGTSRIADCSNVFFESIRDDDYAGNVTSAAQCD